MTRKGKLDRSVRCYFIATDLSNLPNCQLLYSRGAVNWSIICVSRYSPTQELEMSTNLKLKHPFTDMEPFLRESKK